MWRGAYDNSGKNLYYKDVINEESNFIEIEENVRGQDVYIIQPLCDPVNNNLMELLIMADALKRSSVDRISVVLPYFGYSRQDRRARSARVPITAKVVANMLTSMGVERLLTIDLHADQIQGFFEVPVDHLYASELFIEDIQALNLNDLIIASPDMGGSKRANAYAKLLDVGVVICYKERAKANVIGDMKILGDVNGKDVIIIDDMVDTAGTLTKAADLMISEGAASVRAYCTHGILSADAYEKIEKSSIMELVITNTIPKVHNSQKVREVSVASFFAKTIKAVVNNESISATWKSNK